MVCPVGQLQLLGCQSAKPKHLKGKTNKRFPWVWDLRPQTQGNLLIFFAFQMLRLSGLAAQRLQEAHWSHLSLCSFRYIKFLNLIAQMSCSSIVGMVPVLQTTLKGLF